MKVGDTITVLDKGFVTWTGAMGTDSTIVEAARTSTDAKSRGEESDRKLINYLMRNRHTSPFEFVEFAFLVKAPLFVVNQWVRHRVAEYNIFSARYSKMPDEFYIPDLWREQSGKDKQGSGLTHSRSEYWADTLRFRCAEQMDWYTKALEDGVAREMARMFLPVNIYTRMSVKMNAHALMHFLDLRSDPHAQWEIQQYAHVLDYILKVQLPMTYDAYNDMKRRTEKGG